jgi:cell division protein FtsB
MCRGVFHLTRMVCGHQLEEMIRAGKISTRILGAIPGLRGETHLGWRRVATVAAGLLTLAMGYHVIFGQNGLTAYGQKLQEYQTLDQQLRSLQHENELLKGHVERLQNDPDAIEHQAREELHYTRPGEVIYTMPASPSADNKK